MGHAIDIGKKLIFNKESYHFERHEWTWRSGSVALVFLNLCSIWGEWSVLW